MIGVDGHFNMDCSAFVSVCFDEDCGAVVWAWSPDVREVGRRVRFSVVYVRFEKG